MKTLSYLLVLIATLGIILFGCGKTSNPIGEVTDSEIAVLEKGGNLPGNGGCTSYCARSKLYLYVGAAGTEVPEGHPDFNMNDWAPLDYDGDGKWEICNREDLSEFMGQPFYEYPFCMKSLTEMCPEVDGDGDGIKDRCPLPGDNYLGIGFWCRLMHGKDTH